MEGISASADAVLAKRQAVAVQEERRTVPIKIWAGLGALILAFEIFVIAKWVTGPYFTSVDVGPSEAPDWMLIALRSMEVAFVALWLWCIWHYVITPFRKEGRFSTDGLLCLAFFVFAWFQDPLANYGGAVFTYNSELFNMGSWLNEVPGAVTPGEPGAQLSEPLWTAAIYPGVIFVATLIGTGFMRKVKGRFPRVTNLELIAVTFGFMVLLDVILEAFIFMPLGAYTYAGAPDWISFNDDHYYKFTMIEGLGFGAVWTCWASLRYFKDDKGLTIVERGVEKLKASAPQKTFLRFLALGAFISLTMTACVNIPFFWQASHMSTYPEDVQKRSYFTQGMCGEGTNLACFGPAIPNPRANKSARVTPDGQLFVPEGTELPPPVPIDRGPLGPEGD
jgi:hypothetical protein